MPPVGLIANPVAGTDIRRLVGQASGVPMHEKVATVRRVLRGLAAGGVETVFYMPDIAGLAYAALAGESVLKCEPLTMRPMGTAEDSTLAGRLLAEAGVAAIITLGGDGTNRAVAQGCGTVPLVPISTGTNNVFPTMIDGTIAGLAAGLFATGAVDRDTASRQTKRVEVVTAGGEDFALIDAAVCMDHVTGARAVWDPRRVSAVVMARADPWAVGLSSIGGRLCGVSDDDPLGLYVQLGRGPLVTCVLAPGLVVEVPISGWRTLALDEEVSLDVGDGTIAFDGERQLSSGGVARARVTRAGPVVVDIRAVLAAVGVRGR
ncbi:MAG: NAD(+)/NADH kinase [Candidatus Dormiibacterota bacterium]